MDNEKYTMDFAGGEIKSLVTMLENMLEDGSAGCDVGRHYTTYLLNRFKDALDHQSNAKKYIGVQAVQAELAYSEPSGANALRLPGYRVIDSGGNEKWMPKDEFEKIYRPVEECTGKK